MTEYEKTEKSKEGEKQVKKKVMEETFKFPSWIAYDSKKVINQSEAKQYEEDESKASGTEEKPNSLHKSQDSKAEEKEIKEQNLARKFKEKEFKNPKTGWDAVKLAKKCPLSTIYDFPKLIGKRCGQDAVKGEMKLVLPFTILGGKDETPLIKMEWQREPVPEGYVCSEAAARQLFKADIPLVLESLQPKDANQSQINEEHYEDGDEDNYITQKGG